MLRRAGLATGVTIATLVVVIISAVAIGIYATHLGNLVNSTKSKVEVPIIEKYVSGTVCRSISGINLEPRPLTLTGFLMFSNSTAILCVLYDFQATTSQHIISFSQYASVTIVKTSPPPPQNEGPGFSYVYYPAQGISIASEPSSITIGPSNSSTSLVINYTITASDNANGFFSIFYLNMCPTLVPFSIGYGDSAINASDFHGFFFPSDCPSTYPEIGHPQIVGYAGAGTLAITAQSETT